MFDELTVLENFEVGGFQLPKKELKDRIKEVFGVPSLEGASAPISRGKLSGGEQQMPAVASALVPRPKFLMLDEPSLGLAPNLVTAVLDKVCEINHDTGIAVLIVEQKVRDVLHIANRAYGLGLGKVMLEGSSDEIGKPENLHRLFLG